MFGTMAPVDIAFAITCAMIMAIASGLLWEMTIKHRYVWSGLAALTTTIGVIAMVWKLL